MKIISVVGARPNFMKVAPFIEAIQQHNSSGTGEAVEHLLVHTGQHYDDRMSDLFFEELGIPHPDLNLNVGSGTHAEQVGYTMIKLEKVLMEERPDWVVVLGDVNATIACSLAAKKLSIKVCHIEAGLRSRDMHMPEEINRIVTDRLSDLLLTPDRMAIENLKEEGVPDSSIAFVGNIMIDTLHRNKPEADKREVNEIIQRNILAGQPALTKDFKGKDYIVVTLHRPSNVDHQNVIEPILDFFKDEVVKRQSILWPIHPRTRAKLKEYGLLDGILANPDIYLLEPLGYLDMLRMNSIASLILTDSGGLQEESTVLQVPCLTMRWNTERPVTLKEHGGASSLVGNDVTQIREQYLKDIETAVVKEVPELWDGNTAQRCLAAILATKQDNQ
jgi:UDP-N-acetylglucosamine 2-epimerase (non-hydrolysing)